SVYGFIGWDGPYFLDGNENKRLDRNGAGDPLSGEVSSSAKGFALNDLNLGIFVGVSVDLTDPKGYVALNLDIDSFEAVGLDFLDLDATLAVRINVGLSLDSVGAIDFTTSFPDDGGFLVNTGDPDNPVLLDFDSFLVNIEFAGNMTILAGGTPILALLGTLYIETDGTEFKLFASANLRIGPDISVPANETPLLDISALGVIVINSSGFAADLDVDLDVGLDDIGLSFGVSARVIVNTTGEAQEVRIPQRLIDFLNESDSPLKDDVLGRLVPCEDGPGQCYAISAYAPDISDIPTVDNLLHNPTGTIKYTTAKNYIVAIISGNVEFAGFASGTITAGILVSPSLFQLYVDLYFMIGTDGIGLEVAATGLMEVSDAGLYFRTDVTIKASLTSMLMIDVSGTLLIDTTGESDPTGQGADRFMLDLRGSVSIARIINVDGHIKVDVGVAGPNTWRFDVGLTGRLGPIVVTGTAWIQSDGQFSVSLYGGIYFGIPGFSISGGLGGTISLTKSGRDYFYNPSDIYTLDISITGSVRLEIIGIGLGASLTLGGTAVFDPARSDTVLSLYAEGCVEILGIETCGGGTIASVAIPVSIFPTPPPILASVDEDGKMRLNVGARSSQRKVANSTTDEDYRMTDMGAGRVRIEAFGYTETYSGITSIEGDFGGGNDTLILMEGFSVPVTAHGGTGNDMLASLGTRAVVFYGDDGNDTLIGGNGADELFGGAGDDYLEGGLGVDSLDAGIGNDLVYGTIASLAGDTILGGSGTDSLEVHGTASADAFTVSADSGRLKIVRGTSGTMYASGFEDVVVTPEEGPDSVTLVGDLRDAGILSISVNLMEGDERSPDTVTGSLLNSADNLRISAGQESPVLSKQYGFNPEHGVDFTVSTSTLLWSEGNTTFISDSDPSDRTTINTLGGNDNVVIQSVVMGTTLDGGTGSNRYAVGSNATLTNNTGGTLDDIAGTLTFVGSGVDVLDLDDSANTDAQDGRSSVKVNSTTISGLGIPGITFGGLSTIKMGLGSGSGQVYIDQLSAATGQTQIALQLSGTGSSNELIVRPRTNDINAVLNHHQIITGPLTLSYDDGFGMVTLLSPTAAVTTSTNSLSNFLAVTNVVVPDTTEVLTVSTTDSGNLLDLDGAGLHIITRSLVMNPELRAVSLHIESRGNVTLHGDTTVTGTMGSGTVGFLQILSALGQIDFSGQDFFVAAGHLILSSALGFTDTIRSEAQSMTIVNRGTDARGNVTVREKNSLNIARRDLLLGNGVTNTGIVGLHGTIDIQLADAGSILTTESGTVIRTAGTGTDITLTADEIDFVGGRNTVIGTGDLTLQATSTDWTYRLGSVADTIAGTDVDFAGTMTLGRRELEALQDGFSQITIGRIDAGNEMFLGDAMPNPVSKGSANISLGINSSVKDALLLKTDSLVVQGDFRVPTDTLEILSRIVEIQSINFHAPNAGLDSGLTAKQLLLNVDEQVYSGGWLIGTEFVDIRVLGTVGIDPITTSLDGLVSLETAFGSRIESTSANSRILISTNESIRLAGSVEVFGVGSRATIQAVKNVTVLQGGVIAGRDTNNVLTLSGGQVVGVNSGGAVIAGARFDDVNGSPVAVQTAAGADAILNSTGELIIKGTVTTSDQMQLNSGTPLFDHSDYFTSLGDLNPQHPLLGHSQYGILLTGTLTTLAADSELKLSSPADVIIMGNINVLGAGSDLLIQSDQLAYVNGFLDVRDSVRILGGVETDGTKYNYTDPILKSSVYVPTTSRIVTRNAGSSILISGATDVDLFGVFVAGGVIGETGVTFTGPSSSITVNAGEQVFLDTGLLASGTVTINSGTAGSDDTLAALFPGKTLSGADATDRLSLVITTAGGITTSGQTTDGSGGGIVINAAGNIEILGTLNAGANVAINGLTETVTYSTEPAELTITTTGRAFLGGHTLNQAQELVQTGTRLRAAWGITVNGGSYSTREGLLVHAASELSTNAPDGRITLTSDQEATLLGMFVAGGRIDTVRDTSDGYLGRVPVYFGGDSEITLQADGTIVVGQDIVAGKRIDLVGGSGDGTSTDGLIMQGSGRLLTLRPNSQINLNAPGAIVIMAPGHINEISAQGFTVSSQGRLTADVTLSIVVDRVDFKYAGTATITAADTANNTGIADLVADLQLALETGSYTITESNNLSRTVGEAFNELADDPETLGFTDPDIKVKLRNGQLLLTSPYLISMADASVNAGQLGFDFSTGDLSSTQLYAIDASQPGSTVSLGAAAGLNGKLSIAGKVRAYTAIHMYSGTSPDGTDIDLGPTGVLQTIAGTIAFSAGEYGDIRGSVIAGGATSDISLGAAQTMRIRGSLTAGRDILVNAGSQLVPHGVSVQIDGTSQWNSTGGGGRVIVTGYNDVVFDGVFGTGSNDLALLELNAVHGNLSIPKTSGWIESDALIVLKGAVVDVQGVVKSTYTTADQTDFEITVDASDTAIINGDLQLTGSMKIAATNLVQVFNTTLNVAQPGQRILFAGGSIDFGKASTNSSGTPVQLGALVTSPDRIDFQTTGLVRIGSGSVVATSADNSIINLNAGSVEIVGSLLAGATVNGTNVEFSGLGADIEISTTGTVSLGGVGIIGGITRPVGGTLAATGDITITVTRGSSASDISLQIAAGSSLETKTATTEPVGTAHAITITTSDDVQVYGVISALQDGADITINSGEQLMVDGVLEADDQITLSGGDDETGVSLLLTTFVFATDDSGTELLDEDGQPIRVTGGTLSTNAGGTITLSGVEDIILSGLVGETQTTDLIDHAVTWNIYVTQAKNVYVNATLNAVDLISFRADNIVIQGDAEVLATSQGGNIDLRATADLLVSVAGVAETPALIQADALVHLLGVTMSLDGQILAIGSTGRVVINAVESATLFGEVLSTANLDLRAGVNPAWTTLKLLSALQVSDLTGGDILINGGTLQGGADSNIVAGHNVTVQGAAEVGDTLVPVRRPVITTSTRTIEVITATREVAVGTIQVPVVSFVSTITTEQVGTESVRVGSEYHTANVKLTSLGYYNPNMATAARLRKTFIEGIDYFWLDVPGVEIGHYVGFTKIDWSRVYHDSTGAVVSIPANTALAPAKGTQFANLTANQTDSLLIALGGYPPFYTATIENLQTNKT
ncbi:hypothetical protein E3A20_02360, partial [Planctomyces bekefii]